MFKKVKKILTAVLFCSVLLSGCGDSPPSETVTETTEQTTVTMPTDLTEEEMGIWESMPDIVTMRVLNHYETETTEIVFLTKNGVLSSVISEEYFDISTFSGDIMQLLEDNIENPAEIIKKNIDAKKIVKLYTLFTESYNGSGLKDKNLLSVGIQRETTHSFQIYVNTGENVYSSIGTGLITAGERVNNERILDCTNGIDIYIAYLEIDPFIKTDNINIDV